MKEYETDITKKEQKVLEDIFSDVNLLATYYAPNIFDPIKNLYREDAIKKSSLN